MTFPLAILTVLAGLVLVHRVVWDLAGLVIASWTIAAVSLGTFLVPSLLRGGNPLPEIASFALAAVAIAFGWNGRRGGHGVHLVVAGLAAMASVIAPFVGTGTVPRPGLWHLEQSLFGSPGGLLFGSPILWAGFVGLVLLGRREGPRVAAPLAWIALVLVAGGPFHAALPPLALGIGASLEWFRSQVGRRPWIPLAAGGVFLTLWNVLFMEQYRTDKIPRDLPVSFIQVTETNAAILSKAAGSPPAWPANWFFAWRHRVTPAKYDVVVGPILVPAGSGGSLRLPLDDPRVDPDLLAEGWEGRTSCDGVPCRRLAATARLFLPLGERHSPRLALEATGPGRLSVEVNSTVAADLPLGATLALHEIPATPPLWHRGVNELRLSYKGPSEARIAALSLEFEEEH